MKNIIICFFILFFLYVKTYSQEMELRTILDKEEYLEGEVIVVLLEIKNIGVSAIYIEEPVFSQEATRVDIQVLDELNKRLKKVENYNVVMKDFLSKGSKLLPGETKYLTMWLSDWYGNDPRIGTGYTYFKKSFLPGKYQMRVKYNYVDYDSPGEFIENKMKKDFFSEWVQFKVKHPTEETDILALKEMKILEYKYNDKKPYEKTKKELLKKEILNLFEKYYTSNYLPSFYQLLNKIYRFEKDKSTLEKIFLKLLKKFPDSYITLNALSFYNKYNKELFNSKEIQEQLTPIIKKNVERLNKKFEQGKIK
ncbi:MAG: hypothetical protein NTX22_09830 [Ignavibacteriales bacterium]|nr:hypothetical protein [Ignavibacteriales bacterium]